MAPPLFVFPRHHYHVVTTDTIWASKVLWGRKEKIN